MLILALVVNSQSNDYIIVFGVLLLQLLLMELLMMQLLLKLMVLKLLVVDKILNILHIINSNVNEVIIWIYILVIG